MKFIGEKKPIYCSLEEFNEQLKIAKKTCIIRFERYDKKNPLTRDAYVWQTDKYFKLAFRLGDEKVTYVLDRNGEGNQEANVAHAVSELSKIYPIQRVSDYMPQFKFDDTPFKDGKPIGYRMCIGSASPIRDSNRRYRNKATFAIEYDLSSAYGQFLREELPDLRTIQYNKKVKKGQIGFTIFGSTSRGFPRLIAIDAGSNLECEFVFDLMESPYKAWVDNIMKQLETETDEIKRNELKNKFRLNVGQFQNINPFWRAMIVEKCNNLVQGLLRDDSIYWSTDSIISASKRDDIFKTGYKWTIKNQGLFKLKDKTSHQWDDKLPIINGPQKRAIKWYNDTHDKKFDLLTDKIPTEIDSLYVLNQELVRIEENKGVMYA